jgi:hypothetical protein
MRCPLCRCEQGEGNQKCINCGVIFIKAAPPREPPCMGKPRSTGFSLTKKGSAPQSQFDRVYDFLFPMEPAVNAFFFGGRVILYLFLLVCGFIFILTPIEKSYTVMPFMHLINLPFHEAGHVIFSPFGRFIMFLGGTIGQLLIPGLCMGAFLIKARNPFGASASLWWLAQNFIDIAPYINDARSLELMLLGGVTGREVDGHDWENILHTLGLLQYDHVIACISHATGIVLMITSLIWGGYILYREFKNVGEFGKPSAR